jgi:apolipoprotein N-acyltransferase
MVVYGGLQSWVAVLVNALLVAFLALFPAFFAVVVRRIVLRLGPSALMAAPLVWVSTELGRTHLFGGFPWVLLGYSQASVLPIAQFASLFGVYGLSALVSSVSTGLAVFGLSLGVPRPRGAGRRVQYVPLVVLLALVATIAVWGSRRVAAADWTRAGEPVRVGLIQGNVDQAQKWDPARATAILDDYLRMTRRAIAQGAELVVWPESSTPFFFEEVEDRAGAEQVRTIARQARVPILLGSIQVEHGPKEKYYNSAFLVRADGITGGVYRKIHLVPFGEYVPLRGLLFFAAPLVEAVPETSPGDSAVLLPVDGHLVSTAICYEIVYPALVRRFVAGGSELLATITNDAWFGRTSAPYQHFAQASMRAIENGRYLVRSANTGISGVVDPYGRVVAQSRIFEPAVILSQARFLQTSTFYTRHGDVFAYASVVVAVAMLVFAAGSRRKM